MTTNDDAEAEATRAILREAIGPGTWELSAPEQGRGVGTCIARSRDLTLFVKWDAAGNALRRLGELGISPPMVAAGRHQGRPYVIQEYVQGTHPERAWFGRNAARVAALMRTYHQDEELGRVLSSGQRRRSSDPVSDAVADSKRLLQVALPAGVRSRSLRENVGRWQDQAGTIPFGPIGPVHLDPNLKNFILTPERVYLIDWDDVTLSDPLRDVGPLLWWYVPQERWDDFFRAHGMEMTDAMT
ncbi:MAG: aminoglycoside phosphotransferase family protein, partial [Chloroflexi bacterium]|nr:aminoglycoside phosphotransferase family protein [Chloroflexota bacterium]